MADLDFKETLKVMAVLKAAYPKYYAGQSDEDAKQAARLWQDMFSEYPLQLVGNAVKMLIATCKFPPNIADVMEKIQQITQPKAMTEMEAWELIRKALSNSAYHSAEEFELLPGTLQRIVGSPQMLREWAMTPIDDLQTVVQSNFMRSYRAASKADTEFKAIPESVRQFMRTVARDKQLSEHNDFASKPSYDLEEFERFSLENTPKIGGGKVG